MAINPGNSGGPLLNSSGQVITKPKELAKEISRYKVGETLDIEFWRDGETITFKVTLGEAK